MLPTLIPGQIIMASHLKPYKPGSIVIVYLKNEEIIKRVLKIDKSGVWLISDNKKEGQDSRHFGPIRQNQILGTKI